MSSLSRNTINSTMEFGAYNSRRDPDNLSNDKKMLKQLEKSGKWMIKILQRYVNIWPI